MSRQFYERDRHGLQIKADLAAHIGSSGPQDALITQRFALSPLRMLMAVCDRQLRLALAQVDMNRGRLIQVQPPPHACCQSASRFRHVASGAAPGTAMPRSRVHATRRTPLPGSSRCYV